jgi:hypothetical protein
MAGNVAEWVADWYDESYYQHSPAANPLGPENGQYRVVRGGYWISLNSSVYRRFPFDPTSASKGVFGLRCAVGVPPMPTEATPTAESSMVTLHYWEHENCTFQVDTNKWKIGDVWKQYIIGWEDTGKGVIVPASSKRLIYLVEHRNYEFCQVAWSPRVGFEGMTSEESEETINGRNWKVWSVDNNSIRVYFWKDLNDISFLQTNPTDDTQRQGCTEDVYEIISSLTCK